MNITYPKGGEDKPREPINITLKASEYVDLAAISIYGKTMGRNGAEVLILHEGKEMQSYRCEDYPHTYYPKVAEQVASSINMILELEGKKPFIQSTELHGALKVLFEKCSSRYGARIPDSDYEASVMFTN